MVGGTVVLWCHGNTQIDISWTLVCDESGWILPKEFMANQCELSEFEHGMTVGARHIGHSSF